MEIITKDYINSNIRPYSPNDALFSGALNECICLDLSDKLSSDFLTKLKEAQNSSTWNNYEDVETALDGGLRTVIGYYILYRSYRSGRTSVTKYGVTTKIDENSQDVSDTNAATTANYFKDIADRLINQLDFRDFSFKKNTGAAGDLASSIIGY